MSKAALLVLVVSMYQFFKLILLKAITAIAFILRFYLRLWKQNLYIIHFSMLFFLESCSKSYLPITWLFQAPNSHQSISFKIHSNSTAFPTSRWRSSKSVWTTRPVLISSKCAYKHNRTRQYWCKYPAVFECRKFKCVYFSAVFLDHRLGNLVLSAVL